LDKIETMKLVIKQNIAICFLFLVLFNSIGTTLLYIGWKSMMSEKIEEMAKTMPLNSLTKITKPFDGYIEHEFELNGKMFDVISYQLKAGEISYYCIYDFEEECINSADDNELNNCIAKCKQSSKNIAKRLFNPITAVLQTISFVEDISFHHSYAIGFYSLLDLAIENTSPPPKV
jgi:hypothetical protein